MMPLHTMVHGTEIEVKDSEDIEDARMSPNVWKTVNCSTKDERQDRGDKKRLARHQLSNLLCLLTCAWIGGGQHGVISLRALPFRTSMCSAWGTWCACVYLVVYLAPTWHQWGRLLHTVINGKCVSKHGDHLLFSHLATVSHACWWNKVSFLG